MKPKEILKILSAPLIILAAYFLMYLLWKFLNLPAEDELVNIVTTWINTYGIWIVFVSALVEGILLFGNYYPGGIVIFLGVISAGKDVDRVVLVVFLVCLALFFSYIINYVLGRYGWYRLLVKFGMKDSIENQKQKLQKHQFGAIMGSYWFPNLAALTSTAAGILRLPFIKFLIHSAIGVLIWNTFWGILVASLGQKVFDLSFGWVLLILVVWIAILIIKNRIDKRYETKSNSF